jgi:flagellar motility protein MotE (MotC chaperone)
MSGNRKFLSASLAACGLIWPLVALAAADQAQNPSTVKGNGSSNESLAIDYCSGFASAAAEARAKMQQELLDEMKSSIAFEMQKVEKKTAELQIWMERREKMVSLASDELLKIYARMEPEPASLQLEKIDIMTAASILRRLKPAQASAILSVMDVKRASNLAQIIANQTVNPKQDKKS